MRNPASADDSPEPAEYRAVFRRRLPLMAALSVPILLVALVLALALPDVYQSSATIDIDDDRDLAFEPTKSGKSGKRGFAEQYVDSVTNAVQEKSKLRKLVKELDPYPNIDIESDLDAAVAALRGDIEVDMVRAKVLDPGNSREREIITAFTVSYFNRDPRTAKQVAERLAAAYIAADRDSRQDHALQTAQFYAQEAARLREQIADLEQRLAEFKQRNAGRLPELTEANMNAMDRTERDLESVELQLSTLRRDRIFLTQQLQEASTTDADGVSLRQLEDEYRRKSITYDANHPDLVSLRRQIDALRNGSPTAAGTSLQAQLESQKAILTQVRRRYSEEHPDVRSVIRAINALQARIAAGEKASTVPVGGTAVFAQLKTQLNAIDTQIAALNGRSVELRNKMQALESRIESTPEVERDYQNLTRDLNVARERYEQLIGRQIDAQVSGAAIARGNADEFRLLQPPVQPAKPAKPARLMIIVTGWLLGVIAALSAALVAEALDSKVRGSQDVRHILSVAPLAVVPTIRNSVALRRRAVKLATAAGIALVLAPVLFIVVRILN